MKKDSPDYPKSTHTLPMAPTGPTPPVAASPGEIPEKLLPGVGSVIPVASGKGGVGKSTVSANLALALVRKGARVGILDADVYGPSIPLILGVTAKPQSAGDRIQPVEKYGLKVISMAFFLPEGEALIWRGPMLAKAVEQFLGGVEWGKLDYLIVDLPPGTGDIQLSLCQRIPLTGAVIVSTPQEAALQVAERAVFMFRKLNCPVLGIIENMSHYICTHCGEREEIFSYGGCRRAAERIGTAFLGEIPLHTKVRADSDSGHPTVVADYDSPQSRAFLDVTDRLLEEIDKESRKTDSATETRITY